MNRIALLLLAALSTVSTLSRKSDAAGADAQDIVKRSEKTRALGSIISSCTLAVGGEGAEARTKGFTVWRKLGADGAHYKTLTRFETPASIRGEAVLFEERNGGDNEVQLYLPRFKKVRRVESRAQGSSFMGSAFSYSDMTTPHAEDYTHELLKTEPCPGDAAVACHVVRSTPVSARVREQTGHATMTQWIRTDSYHAVRADYVDLAGQPWKTVTFSDIREVDSATHKSLPHMIRVDDLKTKRFSVMQLRHVRANADVADTLFTAQSLAQDN